jgi:hypothetical protein
MFSITFLKDALERAISTAAQALLGAGVVLDGSFFSSNNLKIAGAAAIASILKAIVATRVGDPESAGLV